MKYRIGVISGDGIGPEIVAEARKALDCIGETFGHDFTYEEILMGGCSIDAVGVPLTEEAVEKAKECDAVLMGSIGGDFPMVPSGAASEAGSGAFEASEVLKFICKLASGLSV